MPDPPGSAPERCRAPLLVDFSLVRFKPVDHLSQSHAINIWDEKWFGEGLLIGISEFFKEEGRRGGYFFGNGELLAIFGHKSHHFRCRSGFSRHFEAGDERTVKICEETGIFRLTTTKSKKMRVSPYFAFILGSENVRVNGKSWQNISQIGRGGFPKFPCENSRKRML